MGTKSDRERFELKCTAYHEAGHVVMAWRLKRRLKSVTIVAKNDYLGVLKQHMLTL